MLTNNEIGIEGGSAIGHALKNNTILLSLNLRMNRYVILIQCHVHTCDSTCIHCYSDLVMKVFNLY